MQYTNNDANTHVPHHPALAMGFEGGTVADHNAALLFPGLVQQLPEFLRQLRSLIIAAKQSLVSTPMCEIIHLIQTAVAVMTHPNCTISSSHCGIGGAWAAESLQRMLSCAVAAGLMRHLSGGSVDRAAAAASSASSGSSSSAVLDAWAQTICCSISLVTAESMFCPATPLWGSKAATTAEQYAIFGAHTAVAEVALQLLASRCVVIHKAQVQHQGQQQQRQLLQQLGKRMRGDLLLLSDPQLRLAQLLPDAAFLAAAELAQEADMRAMIRQLGAVAVLLPRRSAKYPWGGCATT
jgi:hypothetical protein